MDNDNRQRHPWGSALSHQRADGEAHPHPQNVVLYIMLSMLQEYMKPAPKNLQGIYREGKQSTNTDRQDTNSTDTL